MIQWNNLTGTTTWEPFVTDSYKEFIYNVLKQLEGAKNVPYHDTASILTIGVGVNIGNNQVNRDTIYELLGLSDDLSNVPGNDFKTQMDAALSNWSGSADNADLNAIMAAAHAAGFANSTTFSVTDAQMLPLFAGVVVAGGYENDINNWLAGIPVSRERAVLFSLAYNQSTANPLLGAGLMSAINNGDRAEAWFEIRYRSNGDGVQSKRRYVESQIFGLYEDGHNPAGTDDKKIEEALLSFRMATKHEQWIKSYETAYGADRRTAANGDLAVIGTYDPVLNMGDTLKAGGGGSAFKILTDNFADFSTLAPDLITALEGAAYNGSLLNPAINDIWVAAPDKGPKRGAAPDEVDAKTVDRTNDPNSGNDLIFGNLDNSAGGTTTNLGGADMLKGGAGNDIWINGVRVK